MKISFIGHSIISSKDCIKAEVKKIIQANIINHGHLICYFGGYGDFDEICASACKELKNDYSDIEMIYVTPYISLSEQSKIKDMLFFGLYDDSLYPPIESIPPKFAIIKRNEWMMSNADLIIAHVNHNYGGAFKALQVAKRKKKKIINICEYL